MSRSANRHEANRRLTTAKEDLRAAETLYGARIFAQACFLRQQVGEKALKAVWHFLDLDPWGHSVMTLLSDFPRRTELGDDALTEAAALLDKFYILTRYPNGLPDLTPGVVYGKRDADSALEAARQFIQACEQWMLERSP
ncbi:MAG: HEPN domain-containing protein [Deltaproteobacteria bacterium]|nr:HEPN domain-containing protein [Deltaproteobacteria bacterium]